MVVESWWAMVVPFVAACGSVTALPAGTQPAGTDPVSANGAGPQGAATLTTGASGPGVANSGSGSGFATAGTTTGGLLTVGPEPVPPPDSPPPDVPAVGLTCDGPRPLACRGQPFDEDRLEFEPCFGTAYENESFPMDVLFVLESSAAMADPIEPFGPSRWEVAVRAISEIVAGQARVNSGQGLLIFNADDETSCDSARFLTPDVAISEASSPASDAIFAALDSAGPSGSAPTLWAFQGALGYARAWKDSHELHSVLVVLIVAGEPSGCSGESLDDVYRLADAVSAEDSALLSSVVVLDGGMGVDPALCATTTRPQRSAFISAGSDSLLPELLEVIRLPTDMGFRCEFAVPDAPEGLSGDLDNVLVSFQPTNGDGMRFPRSGSESDCGLADGGWYLTQSDGVPVIALCPCACAELQSDLAGRVELAFGCK